LSKSREGTSVHYLVEKLHRGREIKMTHHTDSKTTRKGKDGLGEKLRSLPRASYKDQRLVKGVIKANPRGRMTDTPPVF